MEKKDFDSLIESLEQALEYKEGKRKSKYIVFLDKEDGSIQRVKIDLPMKNKLAGRGLPITMVITDRVIGEKEEE